jgi:hypothetical protein
MEGDDAIPTVGSYRGVPLEDGQSPQRLEVVRREIDLVLGMTDAGALARWAEDAWHSPESRQLACAMAESMWVVAAETRNNRPSIDLEKLRGATAGLGCKRWRDPWRYASLLDAGGAVAREEPLPDRE